jgi:hypothetical protein
VPHPKIYEHRTTVTLSMEQALHDAMMVLCKRDGKELSAITAEMYAKYLKEHGDGNATFKLEKWVGSPDFRATPAVDSDWSKVDTSGLSRKELEHLANKGREITGTMQKEGAKRRISV